ncbi:MAG TPA: phosphoribosylglycinamide formyltransferase [Planctomycetota bacterium]|nr:phosphoribosylglycinamide formyltransferase [Planctomycetota bacterium]HRR81417.1 phosphoribosylglycinamide formyltransferase [Planctomycetota bacterium]HRT94824.1 phosphoribosylglycinamide formyltransferase [Planctomycetota bacterium]
MRHLRLAVLLSGSGRTLANFFEQIDAGRLDAEVVVVGASRGDAYGLERARQRGVPTFVVESRAHRGTASFSSAIFAELGRAEYDLLLLAGFMCLITMPPKLEGRAMNIHPALIPAFCGKGYYGHYVHEAVLRYGAKISGCTVHFVDNVYDHGPIILQKAVPVLEDDTADTLADRVFAKECEAYPEAVKLFGEGRLRLEGRRVRVLAAPPA